MSLPTSASPKTQEIKIYKFGNFLLHADGSLFRDTAFIQLPPKELAVLRQLIAHAGEVVPVRQLRDSIWKGVHVSADSLPRCISSLRAHLQQEDCIQTFYKRGYRFTLPVEVEISQAQHPGDPFQLKNPSLPRLAILPFTTAEGVPGSFGIGIAEETMLRLSRSRTPVADVLARDSVFALAARGKSALEVGVSLKSDLALSGSITALPLHFRLRAEMINVADGVQLWTEDFIVARGLISYTDARIAKRIAARILNEYARRVPPVSYAHSSSVAPQDSSSVLIPGNNVVETKRSLAYAAYLNARTDWNSLRREDMQNAIDQFEHALDLDPTIQTARTQLMHTYLSQANLGYIPSSIGANLARGHAEQVLAQSPRDKSTHTALGWIHFYFDHDLNAAIAAFDRAQHADYNPWTIVYRVRFALGRRLFDEAIELLHSALRADPHSPILHGRLAWALHLAGDSHAAVKQAETALSIVPGHLASSFYCANIFAAASERGGELANRAAALTTQLIKHAPSLDSAHAMLAYAHARQGKHSEARGILERLAWQADERFVMRAFQVPALIELGDLDAAVFELAFADKERCPWLLELLSDPRLEPLHHMPQFKALCKFPPRLRSESVA